MTKKELSIRQAYKSTYSLQSDFILFNLNYIYMRH